MRYTVGIEKIGASQLPFLHIDDGKRSFRILPSRVEGNGHVVFQAVLGEPYTAEITGMYPHLDTALRLFALDTTAWALSVGIVSDESLEASVDAFQQAAMNVIMQAVTRQPREASG